MFKQKAFTIGVHLLGWLLFFSFPLVFLNGAQEGRHVFFLLPLRYYWEFCACYFLLFYLNSLYLIPAFFLKKRYAIYFTVIVLLFAGVFFLQPFDRLITGTRQLSAGFNHRQPDFPPRFGDSVMRPPSRTPGREPFGAPPGSLPPGPHRMEPFGRPGPPPPFGSPRRFHHIDTTSLFIFVMIIALSAAAEITQQWRLTEQRAAQAEAGKANAELSFLKAQINPHFLFNTLNNIYTLAINHNEHTADSIMKLSNIMRYVTDEVSEDFVPLQNELDCIDNYIELQRLRIGSKTNIRYNVTGDAGSKVIAPLVFMTFIENIFKYGISKNIASTITINITIVDSAISLYCQNQVFNHTSNQRRGIGIANTKERLNHLYPGKHRLTIDTEDEVFTVDLILQA